VTPDHDDAGLDAWLEAQAEADIDLSAIEWPEGFGNDDEEPANDVEDDASNAPYSADPLQGLKHLGPLAIVGAGRIRELASRPIEWAWQDYATRSSICALAGPTTGGKTTLLFLLLLARATAGAPIKLLDREVTPAPIGQWIVLIEGEHGEGSAARKVIKATRLLGLGDDAATTALDRIILIARKDVKIDSLEWLDVRKLIKAGLVSDLALDTIARVAPADANSEADQVKIFDSVAKAIELAPTAAAQPVVWLVAHTRKGGATELEDVSGSTQRVGQSDSVIMVTPERDPTTHQVMSSTITLMKAREDVDNPPVPMQLVIADGKATWSAKGASGAMKLPDGVSSLERKILEFLSKQNELRSSSYIATAISRDPAKVKDALESLFRAGHAESVEKGVTYNGRNFDGFATPDKSFLPPLEDE